MLTTFAFCVKYVMKQQSSFFLTNGWWHQVLIFVGRRLDLLAFLMMDIGNFSTNGIEVSELVLYSGSSETGTNHMDWNLQSRLVLG